MNTLLNTNLNETLLGNITFFIESYGMSESECLGECGIHSNFISNLRTGKLKKPSVEDIYKIAQYFKVSVDRLICYTPEKGEPELIQNKRRDARVFYAMYRKLDAQSKEAVNQAILEAKTKK